jgi:hypothetical protein
VLIAKKKRGTFSYFLPFTVWPSPTPHLIGSCKFPSCILLISVFLMFLHLAHIGIFDVSASCIFRYIWCFCILHISVFLMFLHLAHIGIFETSNIPIYARCRNIKHTDICKMQKHQKYRYMQDAETSNIPIYARCRNIKYTDMSKMQKHQKYRYIYRYFWCFCILHISVYLMFLHLAYIGMFDVSASCSYRYIWCFCILHISTSNIPIWARCRNIKNTDMSKMQKHRWRYAK